MGKVGLQGEVVVVVGMGFVVVGGMSLVCGVVWLGDEWGGGVVLAWVGCWVGYWCWVVWVGWRHRVGVGVGLVCARHCQVGV